MDITLVFSLVISFAKYFLMLESGWSLAEVVERINQDGFDPDLLAYVNSFFF